MLVEPCSGLGAVFTFSVHPEIRVTMDHSSFIYFMSPDNALISMYRIKDDADFVTKDLTSKMAL